MGGRGASGGEKGKGGSSSGGGGGSKSSSGTGNGQSMLNSLLGGQTLKVENPANGVVFSIKHIGHGKSDGLDRFQSKVIDNPKKVLGPLLSSTNINTFNLKDHANTATSWLDKLRVIK